RVPVLEATGEARLERIVRVLATVAEEADLLCPVIGATVATDGRRELPGEEWAPLVARNTRESVQRWFVDANVRSVANKRVTSAVAHVAHLYGHHVAELTLNGDIERVD